MKIYGNDGKEYNTIKECEEADKLYEEKLANKKAQLEKVKAEKEQKEKERKKRADEVNNAYNLYVKLLNDFVKDYGTYHTKLTIRDISPLSFISNIFDLF